MSNTLERYNGDDEFIGLLFSIWHKKLFIVSITTMFSIISVIYSLGVSDYYTSNATLAPVNEDDSISSKLGSLSSVASITGFSLPDSKSSKAKEAIVRIESYDFFNNYFLPNVDIKNITSVKSWDKTNNKLIYYQDDNNQQSHQDAYKFYKNMIQITEYKSNGFISLSIMHKSPFVAKDWLDIIIYNINESMRKKDIETSQNAINYLNETVKSTNIQSVKNAVANLLESQIQIQMIANSNKDYVLKVLDSPYVPQEKSSPSRALIVILGSIIGLIFSLFAVVSRLAIHNLKKLKN